MKDLAKGFKCLKCMACGDVSKIRDMDCKIPRPRASEPSPPSSSTSVLSHPNALGASAAVVGRDIALKGVEKLEKEKQKLEDVKRKLSDELDYQALLEEEEQLELAILEMELLELEEKQIIESVMEESLKPEPVPVAPVDPSPANPEPLPETKAPSQLVPSGSASSDGNKGKKQVFGGESKDELLPLSPASQRRYRSYWTRFVATPQNHHARVPGVEAPPVPPVCN